MHDKHSMLGSGLMYVAQLFPAPASCSAGCVATWGAWCAMVGMRRLPLRCQPYCFPCTARCTVSHVCTACCTASHVLPAVLLFVYRTVQYEFMQLCEQLGAEPLWVVNVGISQSESVNPEELRPWLKV